MFQHHHDAPAETNNDGIKVITTFLMCIEIGHLLSQPKQNATPSSSTENQGQYDKLWKDTYMMIINTKIQEKLMKPRKVTANYIE